MLQMLGKREKKYEIPHPLIQSSAHIQKRHLEMKIKVQYLSLVKSFTNRSQDEFELEEGALLSEVLDKIATAYGKAFIKEVYDPNQKEMKATFVAMINGVLMDQLKGANTPLKDGDNVILMSLMTGG